MGRFYITDQEYGNCIIHRLIEVAEGDALDLWIRFTEPISAARISTGLDRYQNALPPIGAVGFLFGKVSASI